MADRIRGQEVTVALVINNVPQLTTTDIRSIEIEWQFEIQKEGYLGETTDRRDMIFRGIRGQADFHFENPDILTVVVAALLDRATRRIPGTQINMKAALNFPSGKRALIAIPQLAFGGTPMKFGSRTDYGDITLPFEAAYASVA